MEVHHNSKTKRTKWTHFAWEFLMLFLAVFAGLLAENQREKYVERQQEKQYMRSMIEDLQADTAHMNFIMDDFNERLPGIKICLDEFPKISDQYSFPFYNNMYRLTGFEDFIPNDRTLQQLKNAGGMRLIENKNISDSIMEYDKRVKDLVIEQTAIWEFVAKFKDIFEILDADIWIKQSVITGITKKTMVITNDKSLLGKYYGWISEYHNIIPFYVTQMKQTSDYATRLMKFIRNEYDLD